MPVNWDKKSFSLPARSSDADPKDFGQRWDSTFPAKAVKPEDLAVTRKVEVIEVKHIQRGIDYPTPCAKCGDIVGVGDQHWAHDGEVQCAKCGPFGGLEG